MLRGSRERELADRRMRGKGRVKRRRASAALRDRFNRTVNRQAGSFVLMLLDILFHSTLQLRTGSGAEVPPAYRYAATQLLHGNIYESSLIYQALINSWLRLPSSVIETWTAPFLEGSRWKLKGALLPFK
jgi:hypothetical protein